MCVEKCGGKITLPVLPLTADKTREDDLLVGGWVLLFNHGPPIRVCLRVGRVWWQVPWCGRV